MEERRTLVLPATTEWHDTGINLLRGDRLTVFSPEGSWSNHNGRDARFTNADGFAGELDPLNYIPNAQRAALIGRIGEHTFLLGRRFSGNSPARGRLYLAMNDREGTYGDNAGRIIVEIVKIADPVPMPDVDGLNMQQARSRIAQAIEGRLEIGVQESRKINAAKAGTVVATAPTAGKDLRESKDVVLTVSSGPKPDPPGNGNGEDASNGNPPPEKNPESDQSGPNPPKTPPPTVSPEQFKAVLNKIHAIEFRLTVLTVLCIVLCGAFVLTARHLLKKIRWIDGLRTNVRIVPGDFRVEGDTLRDDIGFQFRMRVHPGVVDFPNALPIAENQWKQTP